MSDQGEKTCPLCAEEMDLTDQQLKPCKCGYEICIWCWHHIMDMAEKDESEGRCPACRTPYNKEKIVGTAPNCEKLVAEMSMEKKLKSHKGKGKTSESRKQLCSVRVIQRNLVYIVGLPLNLADEDILQNKEYFSQYGKVMKVSISRTAAGAIQQFPNNTCSVYITYSKEEEAVRCIQSVHGFLLDGKPLKACFGTTKYCHAWVRNVPCTNPDCLYLHEIGSQEDSFTKDEIISVYTRNRVQQITGVTNSVQRRSGTNLPPPADNYCNNSLASAAKPICKTTTSNSATTVIISPPNSSSCRSAVLPAGASWGTRSSNNQPPPSSSPYSNGPLKTKPEMSNCSVTFSAAVVSTSQSSLHAADRDKQPTHVDEISNNQNRRKIETPETSMQQHLEVDDQDCVTETPSSPVPPLRSSMIDQINSQSSASGKDKHTSNIHDTAILLAEAPDQGIHKLCTDVSSLSIDRHQWSPLSSHFDKPRDILMSEGRTTIKHDKSDSIVDLQMQVVATQESGEHISNNGLPQNPSMSFNSSSWSPLLTNNSGPDNANVHIVDRKCDSLLETSSSLEFSSGYKENIHSYADRKCDSLLETSSSLEFSNGYKENADSYADQRKYANSFEGETATADMGESSIISNILSLDFDPWNAPLTSPQNLSNLRLSNSLKLHTSNQSRFSFAREDKSIKQAPGPIPEASLGHIQQSFNHPLNHDLSNIRNIQDNHGPQSGFSLINNEDYNVSLRSYPTLLSNNLPVSRPQMSAPPGFSAPNRAPPPGFTSHERVEKNFNFVSGDQLLDSAVLQNHYQNPPANLIVDNDGIELLDPAILAVVTEKIPIHSGANNSSAGFDLGQSFPTQQINNFENELRLQLLMQRPLPSQHQNHRLADGLENFSPFHEAYGLPPSNISPFTQFSVSQSRGPVMSNGHWDVRNGGVNSVNELGMAEIFRSERMGGLNNVYHGGYDDSKFSNPNSGNFYNRTFGI
ncbi:unnamed protein product [Cuscuta epithymum]|uniref:CCR4-NOT transcription complex subunit 4 n=1 Tax=Cuscuta epithymum TaxID=186058 RepID=A0AAV0DU21_9ASTE|nr:unnamed protein product [Cuscuta epithymum]CAH9135424.1 unnamed protein product [Cuscuta epithymum]